MWVWTQEEKLINLDYIREVSVKDDGKVQCFRMEPAADKGEPVPLAKFGSGDESRKKLVELSEAIDEGKRIFEGFLPPNRPTILATTDAR